MTATLTFRITFDGSFAVATGGADDNDDRVADPRYLPASSFKGLLRAQAEEFLGVENGLIEAIFGSRTPDPPATDDPDTPLPRQADHQLVPGAWRFSDIALDGAAQVTTSARIQIGANGAVKRGALRIGQDVWAYSGSMDVTQSRPLHDDEAEAHRLVLRAAARSLVGIGSTRRRGAGWVRVVDDAEWTSEDSRAFLALDQRAFTPPTGGKVAVEMAETAQNTLMVEWTYRVVAQQRISAGRGDEVRSSKPAHQVIPGSVIRGALASAWMRDHGLSAADQAMADTFERDLIVGQAVPVGSTFEPCSLQIPKYGAEQVGEPDLAVQVRDRLPEETIKPATTGRGWKVPGELSAESTRTAIDARGRAKNGMLFTRQALETSTVLRGRLRVPAGHPILDWLGQQRHLWLGGQLSVSGRASWSAHPLARNFESPGERAVLLLVSPLILVDEVGSPTLDARSELRRVLGPGVTVEASWVRTIRVGGWHAASGLPKPEDWALAAGSALVLDHLPDDAVGLLADGLGLRRQEGYGEVTLVGHGHTGVPAVSDDEEAPPDLPTSAPPQRAPVQEPPSSLLATLLTLVTDPSERREVLSGLSDLARDVRWSVDAGNPTLTSGMLANAGRRPWLRGRPGLVDMVVELVQPENAAATRLAADQERQGMS